jgi:transcriptional regulator with XRE-family HTH domain/mannose-6-phosphate isomerase-like protein (cupin superfamily)
LLKIGEEKMFNNDAPSVDVGGRLRELRESQKISMRGLAVKSGLSANALSMIERGKTSPSVSTLYKLADALGIPITEFFSQQLARQKVVHLKADARPRIPFTRGVMETLGGEMFVGKVSPFVVTLESGASSGPNKMIHTGHEFVFCLRGMLEYQVEGQFYTLGPGDSLLFAAHLRHSWRNPGGSVTNAIILIADHTENDQALDMHWAEAGD